MFIKSRRVQISILFFWSYTYLDLDFFLMSKNGETKKHAELRAGILCAKTKRTKVTQAEWRLGQSRRHMWARGMKNGTFCDRAVFNTSFGYCDLCVRAVWRTERFVTVLSWFCALCFIRDYVLKTKCCVWRQSLISKLFRLFPLGPNIMERKITMHQKHVAYKKARISTITITSSNNLEPLLEP